MAADANVFLISLLSANPLVSSRIKTTVRVIQLQLLPARSRSRNWLSISKHLYRLDLYGLTIWAETVEAFLLMVCFHGAAAPLWSVK